MRDLASGKVHEFEEPVSFIISFPGGEFEWGGVVRFCKDADRTLRLEFDDDTYMEVHPPYQFFRIEKTEE